MIQTPEDPTLRGPEMQTGDNPTTVTELDTFSPEELQIHLRDLNVEERTLSGKELRDSEARYRRLFEAAHDGILILDEPTGSIVDVNPFMVKLLGAVMKKAGGTPAPSEPTTRECPLCLSVIPIKAKRCSHCTADLTVPA